MQLSLLDARSAGMMPEYHAIRRRVLFEARGRSDYDPTNRDELNPANLPLLAVVDGLPVGTVRLDSQETEARVGIVRLVAIRPEFQGKGIGAAMMLAVERVAADAGMDRLRTSAAEDAVGFYLRIGWSIEDAGRRNPVMTKSIPV